MPVRWSWLEIYTYFVSETSMKLSYTHWNAIPSTKLRAYFNAPVRRRYTFEKTEQTPVPQDKPESIRMNYSKLSKGSETLTNPSVSISLCLWKRVWVLSSTYTRTDVCIREFNARRTGRTMPCMDTMGIVWSETEWICVHDASKS